LRLALLVWLLILGVQFLVNSYQTWAAPHKIGAGGPGFDAHSGERLIR
jgi:hypothetical protein